MPDSLPLGLIAREETAPIDFAALRRERRDRVLAAMDGDDLDALILGRPANARYASGARQLWMAGTRPFGPGCVVVRETGAVHLIATGDEGLPPEVDRENLIALSWNPMNLIEAVGAIPGVGEAQRVGVDGMTVLFSQLLPMAAPEAQLVDAEPMLRRVRATKTAAELACLRTACAVAEGALAATLDDLRPGVTERQLRARYLEHAARLGVTTPALDPVFVVLDPGQPRRHLVSGRSVGASDLVACHVGVLYAGYEGSLERTVRCPGVAGDGAADPSSQGRGEAAGRCAAVIDRLVDTARPGATGADLRDAYEATGEALPADPLAHGLGLGFEPPVVGTSLGREFEVGWTLEPGTVLAVHADVDAGDGDRALASDVVHVGPDGPQVLTRLGRG